MRFTEPVSRNEPHLGSALSVLSDLVDRMVDAVLPPERIGLLGFSQGACLALEFALRRAQRLGAVISFSGGLLGEAVAMPPAGAKLFGGMPVLLGCSERDLHIPLGRVRETEAVLRALGAEVATHIYPGGSHDINEDELGLGRRLLARVAGAALGTASVLEPRHPGDRREPGHEHVGAVAPRAPDGGPNELPTR